MQKKIIFITGIIAIIIVIGIKGFINFKSQSSNNIIGNMNNIQYKNIVDKISDSNLVATFYYDSLSSEGLNTDTYIWKDKKFTISDDIYMPTYANKYSVKSVDNLKNRLKLTKSPMEEYGQLYFYGNTLEYELFIFDCSRTGKSQWKVYFLYDSTIKEVDVEKDIDEVRLDSYQITEDAVFLYTRGKNDNSSDIVIYKILTSDYRTSKVVVPLSALTVDKVIVQLDKIFIKDDYLILATSNFNDVFEGQGVILRYNLLLKTSETIFVDYTIHKAFSYNDQYLILCNDKDSYSPCIKLYSKDFKLIKSNKINFKPKEGNIVIGARDYFYYLKDNKLYGSLSIDGVGNVDYLIVLDVTNSDILYLTEIVNKKIGYVLQDVKFHLNVKGKFIDLE